MHVAREEKVGQSSTERAVEIKVLLRLLLDIALVPSYESIFVFVTISLERRRFGVTHPTLGNDGRSLPCSCELLLPLFSLIATADFKLLHFVFCIND